MQNLRFLACSVWAVGGGGFDYLAAHLIFGGNLYVIDEAHFLSLFSLDVREALVSLNCVKNLH